MKRSIINAKMQDAVEFFRKNKFELPPFAYWGVDDWKMKGEEVSEIVNNELGWDITDYGMGEFERYGLLLFTLRNGNMVDWNRGIGKPYAEKIMIAEVDQIHQMHFHKQKIEDIINRAGGDLCIQIYHAASDESLAETEVKVHLDGVLRRFNAGDIVKLKPGESIKLDQNIFHRFWAERKRVMIGEVSFINDDKVDNFYYQPIGSGRFSKTEEDEKPLYLLFSDYRKYWGIEQ